MTNKAQMDIPWQANVTEHGTFHESRKGAQMAERLASCGTPEDLELLESVLDATLACQERHPDDPHHGNFLWMVEDEVVGDLNAVEFNLERLIPMMVEHGARLTPAMRGRVKEAIRLGLEEIRRIDVHVGYSNIAVLDIVNSCLGGELLGDAAIAGRGYDKLARWMAFTDQSGIPREYNSPTYTVVILNALKRLADLTTHEPTRVRARTIAARIGVSVGLHIHRATGRWAGPHARVYHPTVVAERPAEIETVREWLADGTLPFWAADLVDPPRGPFAVTETAGIAEGLALTTYQSPSFALGVASREYGGQADVLMAHFVRRDSERPGVMYTRYVMNDKWLGDFYHATDRTKTRNLVEEGRFFGVQDGNRAIGLYAPQDMGQCRSAKAAFVFTERERVDAIWIDDRSVGELPAPVPAGCVVVVESGDALIAIRPLSRSDAGRNAPMQLVEKQGDLVFEIYNYKGPEKPFWELRANLNPFFRGHAHLGVYVEVAERSEWSDGRMFAAAIASGTVRDTKAAPFTTDFASERPWSVEYERDGSTLGIEVDLMKWNLKRRWNSDGEIGWPMLESPNCRETRNGDVAVGGAALACGQRAAWIFANPEARRWVAGYHGPESAPLRLTVPGGEVFVESMGTGTVVWDGGNVTIDAIDVQGTPRITGGRLIT